MYPTEITIFENKWKRALSKWYSKNSQRLFAINFDVLLEGAPVLSTISYLSESTRVALSWLRRVPGNRVLLLSGRSLNELKTAADLSGVGFGANYGLDLEWPGAQGVVRQHLLKSGWRKGFAIRWVARHLCLPDSGILMLGGDPTDEEAFRSMPRAMRIRLGEGETVAPWRLANPTRVDWLLSQLAATEALPPADT